MRWVDTSTFSRSDKAREPWIFTAHAGGLRVQVHRIRSEPGRWFVSCSPLLLEHRLDSADAEAARAEAVARLREKLTEILSALEA